MLTLEQLAKNEYGNISKFLGNYSTIRKFLPRNATFNLDYHLSLFLYLYPMPKKKIKIYNTLTEKQKFSFLMKFLMGTLYKEKIFKEDINYYNELKKHNENQKYWLNHHRKKYNTLDVSKEDHDWDKLKVSIDIEIYKKSKEASSRLLTQYTLTLLDKLIKKRSFLIGNDINIDRYLKN